MVRRQVLDQETKQHSKVKKFNFGFLSEFEFSRQKINFGFISEFEFSRLKFNFDFLSEFEFPAKNPEFEGQNY